MERTQLNAHFEETSFLYGGNASFLESLRERFLADPNSVTPEWRAFFSNFSDSSPEKTIPSSVTANRAPPFPPQDWVAALDGDWERLASVIGEKRATSEKKSTNTLSDVNIRQATLDSLRALMMIRAYRVRGHLIAKLDPLALRPPQIHPELDPKTYGFGPDDFNRPIFLDNVLGLEYGTLEQILDLIHRSYCASIGIEFMHISDPAQKAWIQERVESLEKENFFSKEEKINILQKIIEAEVFEQFLHVKYTGTKRFGLDGGESIIPALEQILKTAGELGVSEVVLGMAHRGRLNVLANVMGKPYSAIFHEFKGGSSTPEEVEGSGDVKYHLGSSADRWFGNHALHLSLTANPSHLEIVDPVVLGKARAKQDQRNRDRGSVIPILIHGDAAFAGQGVVAECFGLSGLKGHRTGGSLHLIVNNQIGFTTSPLWARSSPYPSDVAKMIGAPIFHVNGDDPLAVAYVSALATQFRQTFAHPVVLDVFCYRRFGHNESDEPSFTQPVMYKKIADHPTVLESYSKKLISDGVVTPSQVDEMKETFRQSLESALSQSDDYKSSKADWLDGRWTGLKPASEEDSRYLLAQTGVSEQSLRTLGEKIATVPEKFNLHRTLRRVLDARKESIRTGKGIDWSTAEALAFATLLDEGFSVRLSGQDVQRGTFSQRHAVLVDQETEHTFTPLNHLKKDQTCHIEIINSMLSEEAVLGFEYGYSLAEPSTLVLWEAQFGDFANGAQVIFDQFLSSGERKWLRMSGLVCLLPHGYEGQGPEHSSARLERFLQLCAEDNLQVANCTTPANYFHILRRQIHRDFRKPLILMTPKSLLRHKRCVSSWSDFSETTHFQRILPDDLELTPGDNPLVSEDKIRRVLLCSGKVYYDLFEERERLKIRDVLILRIEQLYPFPFRALLHELSRFKNAEVLWCQEEPSNMGGWSFVQPNIEWVLERADIEAKRPRYVGRAASASTAVGLMSKHLKELQAFLKDAFA